LRPHTTTKGAKVIQSINNMALVSRLFGVTNKQAASLFYKSRRFSTLTAAEEAGRRAAEIVAERQVDNTSNNDNNNNTIATILSHAGTDKGGTNIPMAPPLHTATTYTRPPDGDYHGYVRTNEYLLSFRKGYLLLN
jgi:hypothetical protein